VSLVTFDFVFQVYFNYGLFQVGVEGVERVGSSMTPSKHGGDHFIKGGTSANPKLNMQVLKSE
jgi:hypothetical protein